MHWFITDAVARMVYLVLHYEQRTVEVRATVQTVPATCDAEGELEASDDPSAEVLENDLARMELAMSEKFVSHLTPFLLPLRQFDAERAHLLLAFMFDPNFSDFLFLIKFNHGDRASSKSLLGRYEKEILLPMAVRLQEHQQEEAEARRVEKAEAQRQVRKRDAQLRTEV